MRATIGLIARQCGVAAEGPAVPAGEDLGWMQDDADPEIARLAMALPAALQRWSAPGGEEMAMRPDLPAEAFTDLAWTVAALAGVALGRTGVASAEACMATVADATARIIAGHDESETPMAQAAMMARLLRGRPDEARLLGQALGHREILLFAALAGERTGIVADAVLHTLVHGSPRSLAGLCHALGGSASDYRHLLIQLKPVRAALDDAAIVMLANDYDGMSEEEADAMVAPLRGPADLRAKLAMVMATGWA